MFDPVERQNIAIEKLASLLKAAAEAHHAYEQNVLAGKRDEDWPGWYARYIITGETS